MHRLTMYVTTHTCKGGFMLRKIFDPFFGDVLTFQRPKFQVEWKLNIKKGKETTQMVKWNVEREKIGFKYLDIKPTWTFSLLQLQTRGKKYKETLARLAKAKQVNPVQLRHFYWRCMYVFKLKKSNFQLLKNLTETEHLSYRRWRLTKTLDYRNSLTFYIISNSF